jgi:hypothetical protein
MSSTSPIRLLAFGFLAGFVATLLFHQSAWFILHQAGIVAADRPAWPLDPIPPLGVPSVVSKAFWGGLWGAGLALTFARLDGGAYWAAWLVIGALAPTLFGMYVVTAIKGEPVPALWPRIGISAFVNASWGVGTALILRLLQPRR